MLNSTSAIILRVTPYSDSSLIVKAYTKQFGLQSYIVSGIRSKKSKNKAAIFQPLALVEMEATHSSKNNLERIAEISITVPYSTIPYDIYKSSIALFLNEVLNRAIKEEQADEDLFKFIQNSFLLFDAESKTDNNFHIYFLIKLTKYLGFYPQPNYSLLNSIFDLQQGLFLNHIPLHPFYITSELSELFNILLVTNFENLHSIKIENTKRYKLLQAIITFYKLHISGFGEIKSIDILHEILS